MLLWVLEHLKESGASTGERGIARRVGQGLIDEGLGSNTTETAKVILNKLQQDFGITTEQHRESSRAETTNTFRAYLGEQPTAQRKREFARGWFRRGNLHEGD
jgi:hypothetical protein